MKQLKVATTYIVPMETSGHPNTKCLLEEDAIMTKLQVSKVAVSVVLPLVNGDIGRMY